MEDYLLRAIAIDLEYIDEGYVAAAEQRTMNDIHV